MLNGIKTAPGAVAVIEKYVAMNIEKKIMADSLEELKPLFIVACDGIAAGGDQIAIAGALLYKVTRNKWDYSASETITALEDALKAARAAFESLHDPASVSYCWAVKGGAK